MKIQLVDEKNYNMLAKWWEGHNWSPVPLSMLPRTGFIVNDIVAGFIYSTDSNLCIIEWIISDPKSEKNKRKESLSLLLDTLCKAAKELGFNSCFTYTKNKGLIETLEKNNFNKTDEEMIHFIRSL